MSDESTTKLPVVIGRVAQVLSEIGEISVRVKPQPVEWDRCLMCGQCRPSHSRDCLDYGETDWEREAERNDAMDSLERYL